MKKILWITWEEQRRNKPIADAIGAKFYQLDEIWKHSRLKRYACGLVKTFKILREEKPDTIIVQNPSIVLATFAVLWRPFFGYRLGVDTHNGGFAIDSNSKILKAIARFIQRNATFIIAHNDELKAFVEPNGGHIIALPDKIPQIEQPNNLKHLEGQYNFLYICTFANDEPFLQVVNAFKQLPENYHVYITGNYKKKNIQPNDVPSNIHFTGRVPWDEYDQLLWSCDATIDLTSRADCLLCGAYESVACGKPLMLSNTTALKNYFYKGAVYTDNTATSIADCVIKLSEGLPVFTSMVDDLRDELNERWQHERLPKLRELL